MPLHDKPERIQAFPLSFAQQRLWFLEQLGARASAPYHIRAGVRLLGTLDVSALENALDRIVDRHEALRTRIVLANGSPAQVVDPPGAGMTLRRYDLDADTSRDAALARAMADESAAPFDLSEGPLVRARLLRLDKHEHALLVTMHHIVSDGWSIGVLLDELSALYAAFLAAQRDPLPALAIQYVDYAVWQRRAFAGEALAAELAYWKRQLAGAPAVLALPTDRPRPLEPDYAGGAVELVLDERLSLALNELSQRHGITLYMTLLAAWAALLSRLSGQPEVVIGSPVANRQRPELEPLIGFFVNTVALRIDLSGAPTVAELLARVRETTLLAQSHQDVPFEKVVEAVEPERSLAHSPVFQTLFSFQNAPQGRLELPGLTLEPIVVPSTTAALDLALDVQSSTPLEGTIRYASGLFDPATIERIARYFRVLLEGMVRSDGETIALVPLMTSAERQQVLYGWNDTARDFPRQRLVHELFEEVAARTPGALAVVDGERRVSYAELDAHSNRLARHLVERGVAPGEHVAIALPRSIELVTAELAVLKCGAVYVPLDPEHPRERLGWTIADCGSRFIIGPARVVSAFEGCTPVDMNSLAPPSGSPSNPRSSARSGDAAYVMYTSGSTGTPKGVVIAHRSITNLVLEGRYARFDASDRFAFASNPAFDSSTLEVWAPLLSGASLVVIPQPTLLDPSGLAALLQREQVSVMMVIAGLLRAYADCIAHEFPKLRYLLTGGDVVDVHAVGKILRNNPPEHFVHTYGPTEVTQFTTAMDIVEGSGAVRSLPIGRPIANARVYVLDGAKQPVPIGVAGEMYLGGVGVAIGYLNRPELTAERFMRDPFVHGEDARIYKTGDLGRWRPDGTLEFLGRQDSQVKIRGFRVELGEIEARLLEHPAVAEVAVVASGDAAGQRRLVAYYTRPAESHAEQGEHDEGQLVEALRAHLSARLPEYMVPSSFMQLAALPLTTNGKLDQRALPAPSSQARDHRPWLAPATDAEALLAGIWAELLQLDRVGRHDDFFELGGHSLLAVEMIDRMRHAGLDAEVRTLFMHPTLAALARAASGDAPPVIHAPANPIASGRERITPDLVPLVSLNQAQLDAIVARVPGGADNVQDIYPLAPLQEGILFHHTLEQERDPYLMSLVVGCRERASIERIFEALQFVIARHDVLRTAFVSGAHHEPVQVVWRRAPLAPPTEVTLDLSHPDPVASLRESVAQSCSRLDVTRPPLMRVYLAHAPRLGQWLLLLQLHHIATDHTTMQTLIAEVELHLRGAADELGPAPAFREHVHHARAVASREEHEAFFRELLGDVDAPTIPFGLSDVRGDGTQVRHATLALGPELSTRLREACRRAAVMPTALLHAAFARVVAATSFRPDVVFGTVLLGRMRSSKAAGRAIGMLINTLPVRARIDATPVTQAVRDMHALLSRLFDHEHASLVLAKECSALPAEAPLFTALFNCRQGHTVHDERGADRHQDHDPVHWYQGAEEVNYPLVCSVDDDGQQFELSANVVAPLDAREICELLHEAVSQLVEALELAPETEIRTVAVLPAAERARVLGWGQGPRGANRGQDVFGLFTRQVRQAPGATAIVHGSRRVDYAELEARANALALRLIEAGVRPGEHVALALRRSIELVTAQLAVLQVGAAYVPLDPTHPVERLAWMMADCAAAALIAEPMTAWPGLEVPLVSPEVEPSDAPRVVVSRSSDDCANVMYTSGSTGTPKGVRMPHRGIERLALHNGYLEFTPRDRFAFASNPAFDASTMEVWGALLNGACCVILDSDDLLSPQNLARALRSRQVSILFLTTAFFNQCAAVLPEGFATLRCLLTGGERNAPAAFAAILAAEPPRQLLHCYGPTESTTFAISHEVVAVPEGTLNVPLGRPIADTQIYLLDCGGQLVPRGATGEIHIGGAGLALGYLNRAELTAERFFPDLFSAEPGARVYKTGDLARWRSDGTLEFLGRSDFQVKLRGFRVELGEIESRLGQLPGVAEAVVLAREDEQDDKRLVAYVTLDRAPTVRSAAELGDELAQARLSEWSDVFDDIYATATDASDAAFDHVGWNSTYTGKPLPAAEMRDWLDHTLRRVQELRPSRVLEIGCGTGMLLQALAPRCERYVGSDISAGSIQRLSRNLEGQSFRDRVTLVRAEAADFSALPRDSHDTVILNSVVQYFPSLDYLATVIESAAASIGRAGYLFIGDVRHLGLARAFHFSVQRYQATPELAPAELAERLQNKLSSEAELLVDPTWFQALGERLPRIAQVLVSPKLDSAQNELSAHRYDVVLAVGEARLPVRRPARWVDAARLTSRQVEALIRDADEPVGLENVTNKRVARDAAAVELTNDPSFATLALLWERAGELAGGGFSAAELAALCERYGRTLRLSWLPSSNRGGFHAIIAPQLTSATDEAPYDWRELGGALDDGRVPGAAASLAQQGGANDPLHARRKATLPERLRARLAEQLPDYLVPSRVVVLDSMPLTRNGKIDRQALPDPGDGVFGTRPHTAPRGEAEEALAQVWAGLLRVSRVGRDDNFFELGGHSLLAITLMERLRERGWEASVQDLFAEPTLARLASVVRRVEEVGEGSGTPTEGEV